MEIKKRSDDIKKKTTSRVQVHIRLKECHFGNKATFNIFTGGTQLHIPATGGKKDVDRWYGFDHVFSSAASNKEVYSLSGYNLVENALKGFNTAIFAYGQQGSGKTRTLMSKDGVTAHMVSHLFSRIAADPSNRYYISFSYFHIYNEHIYDLLNPFSDVPCSIREHKRRGTYVENITRVLCENPMDVYEMINVGRKSLIVAETKINRRSSRSHAICQLSIERRIQGSPIKTGKCTSGSCSSLTDIGADDVSESKSDSLPRTATRTPERDIPFRRSSSLTSEEILTRKRRSSTLTPRTELNVCRDDIRSEHRSSTKLKKRHSLREDSLPSYTKKLLVKRRSKTNENVSENGRKNLCADYLKNSDVKKLSDRIEQPDMSFENLSSLSYDRCIYSSQSSILSSQYSDSNASLYDFESDDCSSCCSNTLFSNDDKFIETGLKKKIGMNSKITIIDLAGSDRIKVSQSDQDSDRLKEAQNINLSLHELGNVISALASRKRHVPYRNSVLTRLLQGGLGRRCRITFLLCISTRLMDINETKCTLEFGQKLKPIKPIKILENVYKRKYEDLTSYWRDIEKNKEILPKHQRRRYSATEREKSKSYDRLDKSGTFLLTDSHEYYLYNGFDEDSRELAERSTPNSLFESGNLQYMNIDGIPYCKNRTNSRLLRKELVMDKGNENLDLKLDRPLSDCRVGIEDEFSVSEESWDTDFYKDERRWHFHSKCDFNKFETSSIASREGHGINESFDFQVFEIPELFVENNKKAPTATLDDFSEELIYCSEDDTLEDLSTTMTEEDFMGDDEIRESTPSNEPVLDFEIEPYYLVDECDMYEQKGRIIGGKKKNKKNRRPSSAPLIPFIHSDTMFSEDVMNQPGNMNFFDLRNSGAIVPQNGDPITNELTYLCISSKRSSNDTTRIQFDINSTDELNLSQESIDIGPSSSTPRDSPEVYKNYTPLKEQPQEVNDFDFHIVPISPRKAESLSIVEPIEISNDFIVSSPLPDVDILPISSISPTEKDNYPITEDYFEQTYPLSNRFIFGSESDSAIIIPHSTDQTIDVISDSGIHFPKGSLDPVINESSSHADMPNDQLYNNAGKEIVGNRDQDKNMFVNVSMEAINKIPLDAEVNDRIGNAEIQSIPLSSEIGEARFYEKCVIQGCYTDEDADVAEGCAYLTYTDNNSNIRHAFENDSIHTQVPDLFSKDKIEENIVENKEKDESSKNSLLLCDLSNVEFTEVKIEESTADNKRAEDSSKNQAPISSLNDIGVSGNYDGKTKYNSVKNQLSQPHLKNKNERITTDVESDESDLTDSQDTTSWPNDEDNSDSSANPDKGFCDSGYHSLIENAEKISVVESHIEEVTDLILDFNDKNTNEFDAEDLSSELPVSLDNQISLYSNNADDLLKKSAISDKDIEFSNEIDEIIYTTSKGVVENISSKCPIDEFVDRDDIRNTIFNTDIKNYDNVIVPTKVIDSKDISDYVDKEITASLFNDDTLNVHAPITLIDNTSIERPSDTTNDISTVARKDYEIEATVSVDEKSYETDKESFDLPVEDGVKYLPNKDEIEDIASNDNILVLEGIVHANVEPTSKSVARKILSSNGLADFLDKLYVIIGKKPTINLSDDNELDSHDKHCSINKKNTSNEGNRYIDSSYAAETTTDTVAMDETIPNQNSYCKKKKRSINGIADIIDRISLTMGRKISSSTPDNTHEFGGDIDQVDANIDVFTPYDEMFSHTTPTKDECAVMHSSCRDIVDVALHEIMMDVGKTGRDSDAEYRTNKIIDILNERYPGFVEQLAIVISKKAARYIPDDNIFLHIFKSNEPYSKIHGLSGDIISDYANRCIGVEDEIFLSGKEVSNKNDERKNLDEEICFTDISREDSIEMIEAETLYREEATNIDSFQFNQLRVTTIEEGFGSFCDVSNSIDTISNSLINVNLQGDVEKTCDDCLEMDKLEHLKQMGQNNILLDMAVDSKMFDPVTNIIDTKIENSTKCKPFPNLDKAMHMELRNYSHSSTHTTDNEPGLDDVMNSKDQTSDPLDHILMGNIMNTNNYHTATFDISPINEIAKPTNCEEDTLFDPDAQLPDIFIDNAKSEIDYSVFYKFLDHEYVPTLRFRESSFGPLPEELTSGHSSPTEADMKRNRADNNELENKSKKASVNNLPPSTNDTNDRVKAHIDPFANARVNDVSITMKPYSLPNSMYKLYAIDEDEDEEKQGSSTCEIVEEEEETTDIIENDFKENVLDQVSCASQDWDVQNDCQVNEKITDISISDYLDKVHSTGENRPCQEDMEPNEDYVDKLLTTVNENISRSKDLVNSFTNNPDMVTEDVVSDGLSDSALDDNMCQIYLDKRTTIMGLSNEDLLIESPSINKESSDTLNTMEKVDDSNNCHGNSSDGISDSAIEDDCTFDDSLKQQLEDGDENNLLIKPANTDFDDSFEEMTDTFTNIDDITTDTSNGNTKIIDSNGDAPEDLDDSLEDVPDIVDMDDTVTGPCNTLNSTPLGDSLNQMPDKTATNADLNEICSTNIDGSLDNVRETVLSNNSSIQHPNVETSDKIEHLNTSNQEMNDNSNIHIIDTTTTQTRISDDNIHQSHDNKKAIVITNILSNNSLNQTCDIKDQNKEEDTINNSINVEALRASAFKKTRTNNASIISDKIELIAIKSDNEQTRESKPTFDKNVYDDSLDDSLETISDITTITDDASSQKDSIRKSSVDSSKKKSDGINLKDLLEDINNTSENVNSMVSIDKQALLESFKQIVGVSYSNGTRNDGDGLLADAIHSAFVNNHLGNDSIVKALNGCTPKTISNANMNSLIPTNSSSVNEDVELSTLDDEILYVTTNTPMVLSLKYELGTTKSSDDLSETVIVQKENDEKGTDKVVTSTDISNDPPGYSITYGKSSGENSTSDDTIDDIDSNKGGYSVSKIPRIDDRPPLLPKNAKSKKSGKHKMPRKNLKSIAWDIPIDGPGAIFYQGKDEDISNKNRYIETALLDRLNESSLNMNCRINPQHDEDNEPTTSRIASLSSSETADIRALAQIANIPVNDADRSYADYLNDELFDINSYLSSSQNNESDEGGIEYFYDANDSNGVKRYLVNKSTYELVNAVDGLLQQLSVPFDMGDIELDSYENDCEMNGFGDVAGASNDPRAEMNISNISARSFMENDTLESEGGGNDDNSKTNTDGDYKHRFDDLLKQMKEVEKSHEIELNEYYNLLEEYDEEKRRKVNICQQQEIMDSLQTEFDNVNNQYNESKKKITELQDKLTQKEGLLLVIDDELSKLKSEFDILLRNLNDTNASNCVCQFTSDVLPHFYMNTVRSSGNITLSDTEIIGSTNSSLYDTDDSSITTNERKIAAQFEYLLDNSNQNSTDEGFLENSDTSPRLMQDKNAASRKIKSKVMIDNGNASANFSPADKININKFGRITADVSTNTEPTTDIDSTTKPVFAMPTPIMVTFLKSPKKEQCVFDTANKRDASTNTIMTGISPEASYCAQQEPKSEELEKIRSAILVELIGLKNLCDCGEIKCNESVNREVFANSKKDLCSALLKEDGEITDGINDMFSDMFNASPYIFSPFHDVSTDTLKSPSHNTQIPNVPANVVSRNSSKVSEIEVPSNRDQITHLKHYLHNHKKTIDKELYNIVQDMLNVESEQKPSIDVDSISQHELFEKLYHSISDRNSISISDLEKCHKMLNIVRSDHTITVFLQALLKKSKRQSNANSNDLKPLESEYTNGIYTGPKKTSTEKALNEIVPSCSSSESGVSSTKDNTSLAEKKELIDSESDSESDQPQRKGIFSKFLCMPRKSRKSKKSSKRRKNT